MRIAFFAPVAFMLAASPAGAQDRRPIDVSPYVALGTAGTSPVGVTVTFPVSSTFSVETDTAYRRGEDIHAFSTSASLLYFLPRVGRATPYLAGGIGLSQYGAPVISSSGAPLRSQARLRVPLIMGGGVKVPAKEGLEMRTDVRYYESIGGQGWQGFRVAQGISFDRGKR
jgi:hypothetical protein